MIGFDLMKKLKQIFFRLKDREQKLLLLSFILLLTLFATQIFKEGVLVFQNYQKLQIQEQSYQMELSLKPTIDRELEKQKQEQQNKSYSKEELSNKASTLADKVFPARDYRELDTEEEERYSQHKVKISFKRASYEQVNEFASLIRRESPFMFLSEVRITPRYPPKSRPFEPTTFDAVFEVSSVEFINQ